MNASSLTPIDETDHTQGPDDAPVTLIEYGDFECPVCGQAYPIVERLRRDYGDDLRFAFRHLPLNKVHPHAAQAAQAAEAAGAQDQFWAMHATLFKNQRALEDDDLKRYAEDLDLDSARFAQELDDGVYSRRVQAEHDGTFYVTTHDATVAIDAMTGKQKWKTYSDYPSDAKRILCCGVHNRGVAIYEGKLFRGTPDAHVIALDAETGEELWRTRSDDYKLGHNFTAAPQIADHHRAPAVALQEALEPVDGQDVQVVVRLVEHKDVRLRSQRLAEQRPDIELLV